MTIQVKRSAEARLYTMSLANLPEIAGGDTVASVTSVTASIVNGYAGSALTIGTTAVASGNQGATAVLSAGQAGCLYQVVFTVVTTAGYTLVGVGYLLVDNQ